MRTLRCFILIVVVLSLFPAVQTDAQDDRVTTLMNEMTTREKVGQLFMVTLYGSRLLDTNDQFIREYYPGALALFGSNLDYQSAEETTDLVNTFQNISVEASGIPMIVATDQEGGRVWRLINGFTHFPEPLYLGAMDQWSAVEVGESMGREIRAVGVNMNLAPVVDLTTREDALNQYRVLSTRTMGQDPVMVGRNAGALVQGMSNEQVIGVLKHYPGHSPTSTDSHHNLAQVDMDRETFSNTNLKAFGTAIEHGAEVVMVGHLYYPSIEPEENLPASLSPTMIGILRNELGFDGVIMTDAFDMGAIQKNFEVTDAAVMAIQAGVDMIAMGPNMAFNKQKLIIDHIHSAVETGQISEERLNASVERILRLKEKYGILDWEPLDSGTVDRRIAVRQTSLTLVEAFERAVTIVKDDKEVIPLRRQRSISILHPTNWTDVKNECAARIPGADFLPYNYTPEAWQYTAAVTRGREFDIIVFFTENLHRNDGQRDLYTRLPAEKTIVVSLGTPYDYEMLTTTPAGFVAGYASLPEAQVAACRVLSGLIPATGRLPVALEGFDIGHGIVAGE
ncbi:MAG: glycoside hydrolase family 3 protein [Chloroflexi bacterium]|nr:glycoside hydrolase family 3 protein [Chloroflexota bacterium]